jgi:carotenoid 1,2-hydratase
MHRAPDPRRDRSAPTAADGAEAAGPRGPRFDRPVPDGGYHWQYLDGVSDDGTQGIVIIAMVGHPFSPFYHRARRRGLGSPLRFCAMNAAVYGARRATSAFALEERAISPRDRAADAVTIGGSTMRWEGDELVVDLDERTTPGSHDFRAPVRGRVRFCPEARPQVGLAIDPEGRHRWWPVAPLGRIEVELSEPRVRFRGHGYHDANAGTEPLQAGFDTWSWSRTAGPTGARLAYDVRTRGGSALSHSFLVRPGGGVEEAPPTTQIDLGRTLWGLRRPARVELGAETRVARVLEDGPFYARAVLDTHVEGAPARAMYETLDARRLHRRWVRYCTAYRMRRP